MFDDKLPVFILLLCVVGAVAAVGLHLSWHDPEKLIISGRYWATECELKEANIPGGIFHAEMNRLECAGVITHVKTETYHLAVTAYQKSLQENKHD